MSGGGGGGCEGAAAAAAAAVPGGEGSSGALLQRTQVVLLSGEPWGLEGGQTLLSSFAQRPLGAPAACSPAPAAAAAAPGQLVFFLCRASSLGGACPPPARLREALEGLRAQLRGSPPSVLVGVVVQPPPEQEAQALQRLQDLLRETFPSAEGGGPELHAALFAPGRPQGALRIQRLDPDGAPQRQPPGEGGEEEGGRGRPADSRRGPSEQGKGAQDWVSSLQKRGRRVAGAVQARTLWPDKSLLMQVLGAVLSFGTIAYGSYYFYSHPPL